MTPRANRERRIVSAQLSRETRDRVSEVADNLGLRDSTVARLAIAAGLPNLEKVKTIRQLRNLLKDNDECI